MIISNDIIETFENALIQHGSYNDRVYLLKMFGDIAPGFPQRLIEFAQGYSKIFAKIPARAWAGFGDAGFVVEARIPLFYQGREDALFVCFYLQPWRAIEKNEQMAEVEGVKLAKKQATVEIRPCLLGDIPQMAELYASVFPTYPFPIQNAGYLAKTLGEGVEFWCAEIAGDIVALSSAEQDTANENVEMTDFATAPRWRGYGLGAELLKVMEEAMRKKGMKTAYTIAREKSVGMNAIFARAGYSVGGRLINNTNIAGGIESMVVWYKTFNRTEHEISNSG
ncbi:MAG: putative beta-lysine N-acetyltransferase [Deltaproteobacteria bacterium]|nr:putative beta-lysine N-acetyltransferase [Deltaproteobacteria bacterium]